LETKQVDIFAEDSNLGVVRMPGRNFPGSVVQGDSLAILCSLARSICARAATCGDEELKGDAAELLELLEGRQKHYEHVLAQHHIELPYQPVAELTFCFTQQPAP